LLAARTVVERLRAVAVGLRRATAPVRLTLRRATALVRAPVRVGLRRAVVRRVLAAVVEARRDRGLAARVVLRAAARRVVPALPRRVVVRFAVVRLAVVRLAVVRLAVVRFAVVRLAAGRLAAVRLAVARFAVGRLAAVVRFAVVRLAVVRLAEARFVVEPVARAVVLLRAGRLRALLLLRAVAPWLRAAGRLVRRRDVEDLRVVGIVLKAPFRATPAPPRAALRRAVPGRLGKKGGLHALCPGSQRANNHGRIANRPRRLVK
jgi:hypothetical protein